METRDGGQTWQRMADVGRGFNKFQFFGDSLAYGSGFGVYKMEKLRPLPSGLVQDFYENGNLKSAIYYEKGQKNGKAKYFNETGKLARSGIIKNNLQNKQWQFYDSNGDFQKKLKYQNGIVKIPAKTLQSYVGKYQVKEDVFRVITFEEGKLYSKISTSDRTHEIIPISDVEFVYDFSINTRVEFVLNDDGVVVSHIMKNRAGEVKARKVE